jgi:hypothetical protein
MVGVPGFVRMDRDSEGEVVKRITIVLTDQDAARLIKCAEENYRDPKQQAGALISQGLDRWDKEMKRRG